MTKRPVNKHLDQHETYRTTNRNRHKHPPELFEELNNALMSSYIKKRIHFCFNYMKQRQMC